MVGTHVEGAVEGDGHRAGGLDEQAHGGHIYLPVGGQCAHDDAVGALAAGGADVVGHNLLLGGGIEEVAGPRAYQDVLAGNGEAQHGAEQAERGRQSAVAQRLAEFDALRTGPQGGQGGLVSACTYFKENRGHASEFFKRRGRSHASEFFKRKNKLERIKEQRVR